MNTKPKNDFEILEEILVNQKELVIAMTNLQDRLVLIEDAINAAAEHTQFMSEIANNIDDGKFYEAAKAVVIKHKKASTSLLQRALKIGYGRAARMMDLLEEKGVIGPADGALPRKVKIE